MKTSINHGNKAEKHNGYTPEKLSVKDALIWFVITVAALCIASSSKAGSPRFNAAILSEAPVAQDITMQPIVQATSLLPFMASSPVSVIGSYTIVTIPPASEGVLYIEMNSELMAVSEGMMLSADLASNLSFEPNASFNGDVVFTYAASDEGGMVSNTAFYTIPVIAKPKAPLALSLLNFGGIAQNKNALLNWQTANEKCCSHYELQRSNDGKNFEPVVTVTAKGNTGTNSYQYTDDLFFFSWAQIYYRLKMIDINGNFTYSALVAIDFKGKSNSSLTAWPMPFTSNLTVQYHSNENGNIKIIIRSINGSAVLNTNAAVKKGANTISLYQAQTLPAGTYLLTLGNGTKAETIKVVKQ